MIRSFSDLTPSIDKGLALLGATSAAIGLSDVSTTVGIAVGVTTLCMIIPRAMLNWGELHAERQKRAKARRLLDEAERESSDY